VAFARAQSLRTSGANAQSELDDAREARDMAAARVGSAGHTLDLLLQGTRVEEINAGQANLELARAQLASAQTSLADAVLHAPSDGVLLSRVREPGAIVTPTDVVYVLSLTRPVWIRAYVSEPQLGRIHPGMEVDIRSDTSPKRLQRGRIGFISPVAEFTPKTVETSELRTDLVYRLRIIVDFPTDQLRQGMPVTVRVPSQRVAHRD
jgi:HlyD family secretion protein